MALRPPVDTPGLRGGWGWGSFSARANRANEKKAMARAIRETHHEEFFRRAERLRGRIARKRWRRPLATLGTAGGGGTGGADTGGAELAGGGCGGGAELAEGS